MAKQNRKIKDSLFTDLFGNDKDAKKNFLSLYNALHGANLKYEDTKIEQKTISQTIYKTYNNDVSMLINGHLIVMIEHQSTINENMPFRFLEYVTRIYEGMIDSECRYNEKLFKIPEPEFYVFYNGVKDYPLEKELKLSDAFFTSTNKPLMELQVKVINIGPFKKLKIVNDCAILNQYCNFIDMVRLKAIPNNADSYKAIIQDAIKNNILSNYLKRKSTEVINMLLAEYDYETDIKVKCKEARDDQSEIIAKKMIEMGLSTSQITQATGLTEETVQRLLKK